MSRDNFPCLSPESGHRAVTLGVKPEQAFDSSVEFVELLLTILFGRSIEQWGTATNTGRNCALRCPEKERGRYAVG